MTSRRLTIRVRPALILTLLSALLAGCAEMHHGFEAVGRVGPASAPVEEVTATPDVKTARPHGAPQAMAADTNIAAPSVVASAVPSPRQIFDFHPVGSAPGSFRQPFIIDPNDGPLAADVQRSAKELREFMAGPKSDTKSAERQRCSETDVATAKPGCVTPAAKDATAASPNTAVAQ